MQQRRVLREAIAAVHRGDKVTAQQLLGQVLQSDPECAEAWLWMSRAVEDDGQRRECLRRALSPGRADSAGSSSTTSPPTPPADESPLPRLMSAGPSLSGSPENGDDRSLGERATRSEIRAEPRPMSDAQRQAGQRNVMLMGAMTLSLLCGLSMFFFLVATVVPRAHERVTQWYQSTPYAAILWCPSCQESGEPVTLWNRPGGVFRVRIGELAHGTPVSVIAEQWAQVEGQMYVKVEANQQSGWIQGTYVKR